MLRQLEYRLERRSQDHYLLHVRLSLRHPRAPEGGKIRYIDGNPDHALDKGVICAKGASGIMKQYYPRA